MKRRSQFRRPHPSFEEILNSHSTSLVLAAGGFEPNTHRWLLVEPGVLAWEGTNLRIEIRFEDGIMYHVTRYGRTIAKALELDQAKHRAASVYHEIYTMGLEP